MAHQPDPFAAPPPGPPRSQGSEWKRFRSWWSRNSLAGVALALIALVLAWLAYGFVEFFLFDPLCDSPRNAEAVAEECAERGTPVGD